MDFITGVAFQNLIQMTYQGGFEKFIEDGGVLEIAPTSNTEILAYIPGGASDTVKEAISEFEKKTGVRVKMVDCIAFENVTLGQIRQIILSTRQEVKETLSGLENVQIEVQHLSCIVHIKGDLSKNANETLDKILSNQLARASLVYIITNEKDIRLLTPSAPRVLLESNRIKIISEDDLLNLKITLNKECDVNDIINNL